MISLTEKEPRQSRSTAAAQRPSEWLRESDAHQNAAGLLYEFNFGILNGHKGRKALLPQEEIAARQRAKRKALRPPAIQACLRQALEYRRRLDAAPGLSQAALARESGVSRVRLTNLLHLLKLHPEVQRRVLALPLTTARRSVLSEDRLRAIALDLPLSSQLKEFERLRRSSTVAVSVR